LQKPEIFVRKKRSDNLHTVSPCLPNVLVPKSVNFAQIKCSKSGKFCLFLSAESEIFGRTFGPGFGHCFAKFCEHLWHLRPHFRRPHFRPNFGHIIGRTSGSFVGRTFGRIPDISPAALSPKVRVAATTYSEPKILVVLVVH